MTLVMENLTCFERIECAKVNARATRYPKHTHEEYVISANLSGVERIWYNGKQQEVHAGEVTLYNPMTVQASAFCEKGAQFISVHLDGQQVRSILDPTTSANGLPTFQEGVIQNSALFRSILDLYAQLGSGDRDEALLVLLSELSRVRTVPHTAKEPLRVAHLIHFMKANLYETITLEDLCSEANLSRFHLVRSFKALKSLPPMQYLKQLRLIEARRRLRLGDAPAHIAAELGFFDQAHLSNAFRKVMGASPASYRSMSGA
ncbi:AraC family transcriptional regulator [Pseudomonas sp. H9]|uniref:AraC family transcriptional regulator n=1 Tax=Pseudomonas sp. H9 TaxID=483968 RepID=UPI0010579904|nr:AraC family transcriptional regulator [Pseudomonas sp. H9]TDF83771.1 AraC family transcriptional regulator [Pseudomonas sp. H9]